MNKIVLFGTIMTYAEAKSYLKRFKKEYQKHLNETSYIFDGQEVLVAFAKYVIEYLDAQLKILKP